MKFMKVLEIKEPEIAITLEDIANLEKKLNICFPEDYKKHLLKYNGGHPIKDGYPVIEIYDFDRYGWGKSTIYDCDIAWFYAIYDGEHNNFLKTYYTFKIWQKIMPDELIPIGCGSGGDQICISVKGKNYGKVYFWGHDWDIGPNFVNHVLIANSFTDFINSLYETELLEDENGKDLWVYKHDRYSLPVCTEIKKYGEVVKEFFDKAPKEVEEFIIKKFDSNENLLLLFEVTPKNQTSDRETFLI